jgi:hypothetical protein
MMEPDDAAELPASGEALQFFGVVRARARSAGKGRSPEPDRGLTHVRFRDLEALVRASPYELPPLDEKHVLEHQHVVESMMRYGTVLPVPFGIVFRGRRQLIRMLQDQYLALDEGLSFLEGHWELRLHIARSESGEEHPEHGDVAMQLYSDLRRAARAAVPFPQEGKRLLSAAFLVDRNSWVDFVERVGDLGTAHPELLFDVTGPWPAYDFVRIVE